MDKRFFVFLFLASLALMVNAYVVNWLNPPAPEKPKVAQNKPLDEAQQDKDQGDALAAKDEPKEPQAPAVEAPRQPAEEPQQDREQGDPQQDIKLQHVTIGSVDPNSPYSMLVTATNQGAALERIELASENLRDLEDATGYLGHLAAADAPDKEGAVVGVVGAGTPAEKAGLKPGDVITSLAGEPIREAGDLRSVLRRTRIGQQAEIKLQREGNEESVTATLARRPIEVVRPEGKDPLSLLMTLDQLGDQTISKDIGIAMDKPETGQGALLTEVREESAAAKATLRQGDVILAVDDLEIETPAELTELLKKIPSGTRLTLKVQRDQRETDLELQLPDEIAGLNLRHGNWQVKSADAEQVTFAWQLGDSGLEILKQYQIAKIEEGSGRDYHLVVRVELANRGSDPQTVAYQLDGPNGLPIEGWWYANKISREGWIIGGPTGVRDIAVQFAGNDAQLIPATNVISPTANWRFAKQSPLVFIGVDAQYFSAAMVPQQKGQDADWFAEVQSLRVGTIPEDKHRLRLVNTSFRLVSQTQTLEPGGEPIAHEYILFAGPKRPELLAEYGLGDLVYYGWFGWVAAPMLAILHFFHDLVGNYGLAIIMLTVLVRGCMFPLSRKQAIGAQKMQELQPEIKKIAEKYKNNLEARNKAQAELFRKHNYHPLSGCLPMFIQLPIFVGLYRSLMVDVELRQAALIPGLDWCSNLAAPDMLFRWDSWMPSFFADETGWLGPYFNLLPIFTIGLFIWQQKMFMPPPADEQAAMQQKMMKYMMVVMGFMFFKVASGLCIYFIASSLWGIAERKLLPKTTGGNKPPEKKSEPEPRKAIVSTTSGNGQSGRSRKRQRGGK